MKLCIRAFFPENLSRKFKFNWIPTKMTSAFHEGVFTFLTISHRLLVRMRNASNKGCRENQDTGFTYNTFFPENRVVYEIMSKNVVEPERPQMTVWRCVASWISKATRAQRLACTHTLTESIQVTEDRMFASPDLSKTLKCAEYASKGVQCVTVKLSLCTQWRHMRGMVVRRHFFITSAVGGGEC
jgi:hypothetical protein